MVYDPIVHGQGGRKVFTMMDGMTVGGARDAQDPDGNLFPGRPQLRADQNQLQRNEFSVEGTGVWNHYFLPVSDFSPGDPSCENKPLITFPNQMIATGLHSQTPWAPMAWRISWQPRPIEYILRHDLGFDAWIEPKRRNAARLVKNYIRFNTEIQMCPPNARELTGYSFRHSDKGITRGGGK